MKVVYIAAPVAAPTAEAIEDNLCRAEALARHALERGYAPICVHSMIARAVFGDEQNPEHRARGMAVDMEIVRSVARTGGELWVLYPPGSPFPSKGCHDELQAYLTNRERGWIVRWFRMEPDLVEVESRGGAG